MYTIKSEYTICNISFHTNIPLGFDEVWYFHFHRCQGLSPLDWALKSDRTMCEGIILLWNWCVRSIVIVTIR